MNLTKKNGKTSMIESLLFNLFLMLRFIEKGKNYKPFLICEKNFIYAFSFFFHKMFQININIKGALIFLFLKNDLQFYFFCFFFRLFIHLCFSDYAWIKFVFRRGILFHHLIYCQLYIFSHFKKHFV